MDAGEPTEAGQLLSARYLSLQQLSWRRSGVGVAGIALLNLLFLYLLGPWVAVVVFAGIVGFPVFFILVADGWSLLRRQARPHWTYGAWVLLAAAAMGVLIAGGVAFTVTWTPVSALVIFAGLKIFRLL